MLNILKETDNKDEIIKQIENEFFDDLKNSIPDLDKENDEWVEKALTISTMIIFEREMIDHDEINLISLKKDIITATKKYFCKMEILQNMENIQRIKDFLEKMPGPVKRGNKETKKGILIKKFKKIEKDIKLFFEKQADINLTSVFNELYFIIKSIPKNNGLKLERLNEKEFIKEKINKRKVENIIEETKNEVSIIMDKLSSIKQRVENIEISNKNKDYTNELTKILLNLNKIDENENSDEKIKEEISKIEEKIFQIILQKSKKIEENQKINSKISEKDLEQKNKEKITPILDDFENTKSAKIIEFLLSEEGFHHSISSTKNPKFKNSEGDGSFSMKIARPIFSELYSMFKKGELYTNNFSWSLFVEKYLEKNQEKRDEVRNFLMILKNFEKTGHFTDSIEDFREAVKILSKTNYYNQESNTEKLKAIDELLRETAENFKN